ncbi:MAG: hypothetical protein V7746_03425 [Halioglobus sp.]
MFSRYFSKSSVNLSQGNLDNRLVFAVSCLVSVWLIAIDPVINRDAIIYLRTADAFLESGWLAGQAVFDRPLLPFIFAGIHKLTGLSMVHAGQLVITVFYGLLATSFVATIRVMGGDRRVQLLAAILILSHPMLNTSRSDIMRDPAYWALTILAFRELLLYARNPVMRHQLRWFFYIALATLFRFEGAFFAALAPLAIIAVGDKSTRWRDGLRLMIFPAIAGIGLLALIMIYQAYLFPGEHLFKDISAYWRNFKQVTGEFKTIIGNPAQAWLESHSKEDAQMAAIGALMAVLVLNICRALTWPYVALLVWGGLKKQLDRVTPRDFSLIKAHLLISLLYLVIFMLTKRFMLERYSGIVALYLLILLPFILNGLWNTGRSWGGKATVIVLLLGMSLDTLHNRDSEKAFIRSATEWIRIELPKDASITTNSSYIAYFSEREFYWGNREYQFKVADLEDIRQKWQTTDYLVVMMKRNEISDWREFLAQNNLVEIETFPGKSRGKIAIVAVPKTR